MNKRIDAIAADAIEELKQYSWPGNIRELQNFVERSVILSRSSVLDWTLDAVMQLKSGAAEPVTLQEAERAHIERTLGKTGGKLTAAAALLGIPRTTLFYKLRRLGISPARSRPVSEAAAAFSAHSAAPSRVAGSQW